jgi:EAL domain-containing protein (putative c-di-GMP-specific phosphodiesterase class I)
MAPIPFEGKSLGDMQLFFNLHVRDLNDQELYDHASGLAQMSDRVVLEITERASLNEVRDPHGRVAQLREIGFKIAVDDLGAGYAGLTSFATLEPDVVKLDMALVRDIHLSSTKRKLVQSMTQLCADMGMSVVAEGVESAEECSALIEAGCDIFQGYFFGKPSLPFAEVDFSLLPPV